MGIIAKEYVKRFVCRYDKDIAIPYYSYLDFDGLHYEASSFLNSNNVEIHYFYYYYDNYREDKLVIFLHGIGPGHTAYLREIEYLARSGYKVLSLDYQGCGESKGDNLRSLNEPTRDVMDLLDYLKIDIPLVLVGHSLGGYTSLNVLLNREGIEKAVVISPFISIESLCLVFTRSRFVTSHILDYEYHVDPKYYRDSLIEGLQSNSVPVMFIHSTDDPVVPYELSTKVVESLNNPAYKFIITENKGHNPNYTLDALNYMNEVFDKYNKLIAKKKIKTEAEKIEYFKDTSIDKMTTQDEEIMGQIIKFIQ